MIKNVLKYILGFFFLFAGINHFLDPAAYFPLIPDYLPNPELLNFVSGLLEVIFGVGILTKKYANIASWGIILLMILFIPSHIYFIQIGACVPDGLCVPLWIAWVRILLIHPLLIYWAYIFTKK